MLPLPETPLAPTGNSSTAQRAQIINLPAEHANSHTAPSCAGIGTGDACAQDSEHDTDFDRDMLTDEATSTGWYTICCVGMLLTSILQIRAANWANLQVIPSID
jgi:hypothetical protein